MHFRMGIMVLWLGFFALGPAQAAAADAVLLEVSAALAAGQYEQSVTVATSGLAEPGLTDLTHARLLVVRGLARQALDANDDALADFTQALSVATLPPQERARALFARGVSLDSLNRLDDAAGDYSAVLKLVPGATYALNNRGNVRRRQGRLEEAGRDYLSALKGTNPNPQYPYSGLGQIAEAGGDLEAARGYYNQALAAAPGFPLALERLQAMGAPAEGPAGLPADTGIIVLKPPSKSEPTIVLHRPPAVPMTIAAMPANTKRGTPTVKPQQEVPLRPTILAGMPAPGARNLVQLGAWRSEQQARDGWAVARDSSGGLLAGLTPLIVQAQIPGRGTFWRLRAQAPMAVAQFCAMLAQRGLSCIVARE